MTRRERLENRAERRRDWAAARERRASAGFQAARNATAGIPFGQPILVGHHSERRHRAALERSDHAMRAACESADMAKHHTSAAAGIEHALAISVFSDDPDAVDALEARIAEHEAKRERMKLVNKLYAKRDAVRLAVIGIDLDTLTAKLAAAGPYWGGRPHLPYELTSLGARIRTDKERITTIRARQQRTERAEAAPGGCVIEGGEYVRVTFAEKPAREILDALRAAAFQWGGGSWVGVRAKLPAAVIELTGTVQP